MSKHTPGPWEFVAGIDPCDLAIQSKSGHWICLCFNEQPDGQDCTANGHLISAAPELLEALLRFIDEVPAQSDTGIIAVKTQARAAIAKATGASQD